MARRKFRFLFDSPAVIVFAALSILLFMADVFSFNRVIPALCMCRSLGGSGGAEPFSFTNVLDYLRLFLHVFGNTSWSMLLLNALLVLLLGPVLEERYGTPVLTLMMAVTSLVTGVLCVCTGCTLLTGADGIIFMMIILASLTAFAKRSIPVTWMLVFLCYVAYRVQYFTLLPRASTSFTPDTSFLALLKKNLPVMINLAGGIVGSLFGFFVMPRKKGGKGFTDDDATIVFTDMKPRKSRKAKSREKESRESGDEGESRGQGSSRKRRASAEDTEIDVDSIEY